MKLTLNRIAKKETYTIGKLFINGQYFCDTLEDKDRGIDSKDHLDSIRKKKVPRQTAIPTGTYRVTLNTISPKYSNYKRYPWARDIQGRVPRLLGVPGFDGILMHSFGNTPEDTDGCILVGQNKIKGRVVNSTVTFKSLYQELLKDKDNILITIK